MKQLIDISPDDPTIAECVKSIRPSRPNQLPKGWTEIEEGEYYHRFSHRSYTYGEHIGVVLRDEQGKQLPPLEDLGSIRLFYYLDNQGLALSLKYVGWQNNKACYKVRYFKFGCQHDYIALSSEELRSRGIIGHCTHGYKCQKCGHINIVDSSD